MWRVLLVIVVLADPDLISSVGSTRGLSLGNTASNSNNYCFGCCGLHACLFNVQLLVVRGGCGMWIEIPAISPQSKAGRRQPAARQISQKEHNSSVRRQPVRCRSRPNNAKEGGSRFIIRVILDSGGARVAAHLWWEVCVGTNTFYASTHLNCAADESSAAV
jgi:hypothetical protein